MYMYSNTSRCHKFVSKFCWSNLSYIYKQILVNNKSVYKWAKLLSHQVFHMSTCTHSDFKIQSKLYFNIDCNGHVQSYFKMFTMFVQIFVQQI